MQISKKIYGWLLISLGIAFLAWVVDQWAGSRYLLPGYAQRISNYYQEQEDAVLHWLDQEAIWAATYRQLTQPAIQVDSTELKILAHWSGQPLAWLLYDQAATLQFWTDKEIVLPDALVQKHRKAPGRQAVLLNNGFYVLHSRLLQVDSVSTLIFGAIPIQYTYPGRQHHLRQGFALEGRPLPQDVIIDLDSGVPVTAADGKALFYLRAGPDTDDPLWHVIGLGLYLLAFLGGLIWINQMANRRRKESGLALIVTTILAAIGMYYALEWDQHYADLPIFHTIAVRFPFQLSVWAYALFSTLMLWLAVYLHRSSYWRDWINRSVPSSWTVASFIYLISCISLVVQFRLLESLVLESDFRFNPHNVFGWNSLQHIAIGSSLVILLAIFLINHRWLQGIRLLNLSLSRRVMVLIGALLLTWPLVTLLGIHQSSSLVLLTAFIYIMGFDLTLDNPRINLSTTLLWLIALAGYASIIMSFSHQQRDRDTQRRYALALGEVRDSMLERSIQRLGEPIRSDAAWRTLWAVPDTGRLSTAAVREVLDPHLQSDIYLQHYQTDIWVIDTTTQRSRIQEEPIARPDLLLTALPAARKSPVANLRYWPVEPQPYFYVWFPNGQDDPIQVAVTFRPQIREDRRVYNELVAFYPYKGLSALQEYDYSLHSADRLLKQGGDISVEQAQQARQTPQGEFRRISNDDHYFLCYKSPAKLAVAISPPVYGLLKDAYLPLFSYLFALLVLISSGLAMIAYLLKALPETLDYSQLWRASVRNRIMRTILLIMVLVFAIIGLVTTVFFRFNAEQTSHEQLQQKALAVLSDIAYNTSLNTNVRTLFDRMTGFLDPIADVHNMDINIYSPRGQLILTTAAYLFESEVTARRMNPLAWYALRATANESYHSRESIGGVSYQSIYAPLRETNGEVAAYVELPYYNNDRALVQHLQVFRSTLLTIFVFTFLLAGFIALFMTRNFTRRIDHVRQKLRQLRLGSNESIDWSPQPDEIGLLMAEYNDMVRNLADRTDQLRQSEREGAWREMAKQVAHEIKNPLTPMKLQIQHLMRVQQQNPEQANAMLAKVAESLIQQIDSMSHIAAEFSDFAKMPRARNERLLLNEEVTSVYLLYSNSEPSGTSIQLQLTEQPLWVVADSSQLRRVINNLIKNALQAIPDDRLGRVDLRLYASNGKAVLSVTDNGIGIPPERSDRIFTPNFTTKSSGMGLGLAMSRNIIKAAAGRLYFNSEPGKGTVFFVELPLADEAK